MRARSLDLQRRWQRRRWSDLVQKGIKEEGLEEQEEEGGGRGALFKEQGRRLASSDDAGHVDGNRRTCVAVMATKDPITSTNATAGTEDPELGARSVAAGPGSGVSG